MTLDRKEDYIAYIRTKDWDSEKMIKIVDCESGFNPKALNDNPRTGDFSVGLAQVNIKGSLAKNRPSKEELEDPRKNIDFSYELYKKKGNFSDWTCSRKV